MSTNAAGEASEVFAPPEPQMTVYSKPACVQCKATERALTKLGVPFNKIDITQDPQAREYVLSLGYLQAPVVTTVDGEHWSGFRDDRLKIAATRLAETQGPEPPAEPDVRSASTSTTPRPSADRVAAPSTTSMAAAAAVMDRDRTSDIER